MRIGVLTGGGELFLVQLEERRPAQPHGEQIGQDVGRAEVYVEEAQRSATTRTPWRRRRRRSWRCKSR